MATALENLVNEIVNYTQDDFIWQRDQSKQIDMINGMHFKQEVSGKQQFLELCMTFVDEEAGSIHWLTEDEAEEFYLTGVVESLPTCTPKTWVSICVDETRNAMIAFISDNPRIDRSPQQNFAICFTQNKEFLRANMQNNKPPAGYFEGGKYSILLDDNYEYVQTFRNLKTVFEWAKTHRMDDPAFYKKVNIPMAHLFTDVKTDIRDDEYSETDTPDYIPFPDEFERTNVPKKMRQVIKGISYDELFFPDDGRVKFEDVYSDEGDLEKTAEEQGLSMLWSVIAFANDKCEEDIEGVKMLHLLNAWEDGEKNTAEFRITNCKNDLIFELEVRQDGIVHLYTRSEE